MRTREGDKGFIRGLAHEGLTAGFDVPRTGTISRQKWEPDLAPLGPCLGRNKIGRVATKKNYLFGCLAAPRDVSTPLSIIHFREVQFLRPCGLMGPQQ